MITQQKILQLLHDTESYRVDRTTSKANADKFCQAICAFANDISGNGKNG
jgi:ATP-dependent DNA helicase RecG